MQNKNNTGNHTLTFFAVIAGAIIGALLLKSHALELAGLLFGGGLTYLLSHVNGLSRQIKILEHRLRAFELTKVSAEVSQDPETVVLSLKREEAQTLREPLAESRIKIPVSDVASHPPTIEPPRPEIVPQPPKVDNVTSTFPAWNSENPKASSDQGTSGTDFVTRIIPALRDFIMGGNTLVRIGIVILFFGVAFLLKYAADHAVFPIELRLSGVALGGVVLVVLGWRLRQRRTGYSMALQGGGIGILYLTVFAAMRLYDLLPAGIAFGMLFGICAFSALLAVLMDSRTLAVLGAAGGFLAPVLISTGGGSHVMLFSYYALLNLGIVGIAWFKAWRILNLVGFAFTFVIGSLWGFNFYRPEYFYNTEPFLILFFLFYVSIAVLFALRQPQERVGYVDGTMVFGMPFVAFGLQAELVKSLEYGIACSALGFAVFYIAVTTWLLRLRRAELRMLGEAFLAMGVVFATIAIPLAVDGRWTSAAWGLEGAAIVWVGVRQNRLAARFFGMLLQLFAGLAFLQGIHQPGGGLPVFNGIYLGTLVLSLAALTVSFHLYRWRDRLFDWETDFHIIFLVLGLMWWLGGGLFEIHRHVEFDYRLYSSLAFIALSLAAADVIARLLQWLPLTQPIRGLVLVMMTIAAASLTNLPHPLTFGGYIAWPLGFVVLYRNLYRVDSVPPNTWLRLQHSLAFYIFLVLVTTEIVWWVDYGVQGSGTWPAIAWGLVPVMVMAFISRFGQRIHWPVERQREIYYALVLFPVAIYLAIWTIVMNLSNQGNPWPLSYLPLLNPLDVTQGLTFVIMFSWWLRLRHEAISLPVRVRNTALAGGYTAIIFLWLNAVLIRTLHYWSGIPFDMDDMMQSALVQTSLSVFWTLLALVVMMFSTRRRFRLPWIAGAGLLAVVVLKLFVVDLSNSGNVERIVSFIAVGVLLLIIGYFSPLPPRKTQEAMPG